MTAPTAVVVGVGAERGLGAALCRRFAAEDYHLLVAGRTHEKIERVAQTIRQTGGSAEFVVVDTTREDDVVRLFDRRCRQATDVSPRALWSSTPATISASISGS